MLTQDQLQKASSGMSTANLPPPSYSGNSSNGMSGDDLDSFVKGKSTAPTAPAGSHTPGGFLGGIASAPATMLARPVQAAQSLGNSLGNNNKQLADLSAQGDATTQKLIDLMHSKQAKGEDVSHIRQTLQSIQSTPNEAAAAISDQANYRPSSGGIVAAAPENMGDVKKDVGRGIQTVALGMGPVSGGAAFGLGDSLTSGHDLTSMHTAVETAASALGGKILGVVGAPILNAAGNVVGKITPQILQDIAEKGTTAIAKYAADHEVLPSAISSAINGVADKAETLANKPFDAAGAIASKTTAPVRKAATGIQSYLSRGNTGENLGSSIDRLATAHGVANSPEEAKLSDIAGAHDPLKLYDEYHGQEQKFKADGKEDTALGLVGSKVGDAYDKVVKLRQTAGKTMADEMQNVGHLPTDISEHFPALESELKSNGLTINDEGKVEGGRTSKVTDQDLSLINDYVSKLNTLGTNPTAAELDAFLSKTPKDLDVFKSQNNITKTTNGERIIKGHLKDLAESLSPSSNSEFKGYADAKKQYADLSKFLDEGSGFLGKKTSSGDYAKDASLSKSAIQSALNGGKKDWLLKLEDLTGFPAIDHSMMALQAMKDAGNFRGSSLLDILSPESKSKIPLSKEGIIGKVVDKGVGAGKRALVGTPYEQTKRIIEERLKAQGGVPSTSSAIPEHLQSLAEEAKKYKSADEFANAHTPMYRADSKPFDASLVKDNGYTPGTYFSKNKAYADEYGSASGRPVSEYMLTNDAKVLHYSELPENLKKSPTLNSESVNESKRIYDYAKANGYDAVESEIATKANPRTEEFTVINPDKVKTRQELKDLYTHATKNK